jgi:hypothetical protein
MKSIQEFIEWFESEYDDFVFEHPKVINKLKDLQKSYENSTLTTKTLNHEQQSQSQINLPSGQTII